MFKEYTYKTKLKVLLLVTVLLSIAAYKRSFSNLIVLFQEHAKLEEENAELKERTPKVKQLNQKISELNQVIGEQVVEKDKIQQEIIDFMLAHSTSVSIFELKPIFEVPYNDYLIYTFQLDLVGRYSDLIHVVYSFEKDFNLSKITHLSFYTEKKSQENEILHLKLIFQNYESKK